MRNISVKIQLLPILIFVALSSPVQSLIAQELKFKHFSIDDGLSQNTVSCILQDDKGFMWFGTQDGLNQFDGYTFTVYRTDSQDSTSISGGDIQSLWVDHIGRLWVGTDGGGLNLFDPKTKTFKHYTHDPKNPSSLSNNSVKAICEDINGQLWVGTLYGGISILDERSQTFRHLKNDTKDPSSLSSNTVQTIFKDHNGRIWVGNNRGGLNLFDPATNTFEHFNHDPKNPFSLSNDYVISIYEDNRHQLWVATFSGGLNLFDPTTKKFERYLHDPKNSFSLSSDHVTSIFEDDKGRLWMGTIGGGMNLFDRETKTFKCYLNDPKDPLSLSNNNVECIYKDHSGRLWLGTFGGGVNLVDTKIKPFEHYQSSGKSPFRLPDNNVFTICEDRSGFFWVGTFGGGIAGFNQKTKMAEYYKNDPADVFSLSNNSVLKMYEDQDEQLWVGTYSGGLNLFDRKTKKFEHYRFNPEDSSSLSNDFIQSIYQDKSGNMWIGTFDGGLSLFDVKTKSFKNYKKNPSKPSSLSDNNVQTIYEDRNGLLWIGTFEGGLNLFDHKTEKFEHYKHDPKDPSSLPSNVVFSIYEDHNDRLWVATGGGGLSLFNRDEKKFITFNTKHGLPNNLVYGVLVDGQGRLWLSTNNGISRFTPPSDSALAKGNKGIFRNYDVTDGLQSNEFNQSSYFLGKDGKMYFGGVNGLNVFHPDSIQDDSYVPPIVLTRLEVFNKPIDVGKNYDGFVLPASITEAKELTLSYKQSVFTLEFSALSYIQSERNRYAYKLEGFDTDWNYTDANRRFATYTNLDPGTYTFHVKGSNHDGVWNEEGHTLKIIITPPWWETLLFRIVLVMTLYGVVILFFILRTRNIRKTNQKLKGLVDQKTKELQETNEVLIKREKEIKTQNEILHEQGEELAAQNEELVQSQEEASAQRDLLAQQNKVLTEAQRVIEQHNESLEAEVIKRTQELLEYNQQLEQFAFISAHNLRGPVARILGLGQLLDLEKNNTTQKEQIYPKLIRTTQELDEVVKDLNLILDLKKNNDSVIVDVDLDVEISSVCQNLEKEIEATQASISTDFTQVKSIRTVKAYLDSVIYNLMSNAIKYRHPDRTPVIHIKAEKTENEVCLSITDNGLGIDVDLFRDKLFTLYQRFHTHVDGKGMGLYLVKTQMTAMGGRIEIESKVDSGTTFSAYFKQK
jgi:ligand-binding sensor domain-containing protein/signal transduction histidine kinase